ncbi:hypothetical protein NDU88_006472 [Pleurodeles waltl]|uniref:Uncharacterized protein n=1 Tax=Pleurodeles waltl TaxID=8319 RepID=A0AAV7LC75_PLEWA|nr:hypothetical protein NDU88_006472 [Pleurodeles waltl]
MPCPCTKGVRDTALHATAVSQERSCTTRQGLVRYQESLCTPCYARVPRECETLPCMATLYPKREAALHGKAWPATKRASALHAMPVYQGSARHCPACHCCIPREKLHYTARPGLLPREHLHSMLCPCTKGVRDTALHATAVSQDRSCTPCHARVPRECETLPCMPQLYPKRGAALHGKAWSATKRASALHAMPVYQGSARHCTAYHSCIPREKLHYTARPGLLPREPLHSMPCPCTKGVRDTALHATAVSQERSCTTRQGLVRYQESLCTPCYARVPRECETLPCMATLYPKREAALHGKAWPATKRASALHAMPVYQGSARHCPACHCCIPREELHYTARPGPQPREPLHSMPCPCTKGVRDTALHTTAISQERNCTTRQGLVCYQESLCTPCHARVPRECETLHCMPQLYPKREAALHGKAWSATKRASALHAMPVYQGSARHCPAWQRCIPREKLHYTARPGLLPREPLHSMPCPRTKGVRDTAMHATAVSQERSCTTRQGLVRYQKSLCTPCHARVPRECETLPCMPLLYPKRGAALHGKAWSATKRASALHAMPAYQGSARHCTACHCCIPSEKLHYTARPGLLPREPLHSMPCPRTKGV